MDGVIEVSVYCLVVFGIPSACWWIERWRKRRQARREMQENMKRWMVPELAKEEWFCLGPCETAYPGPQPPDQLCWRCRFDAAREELVG